ncbi:MAG: hypothetical protein HY057_10385 [Rhodospirillales bacterium]|nr:hypothetical protein [Rhodospirillales bacterium]
MIPRRLTRRRFLRTASLAGLGVAAGCAAPFRIAPRTAKTPIEHLIVILRENHSYDNYFAEFPGGNGAAIAPRCKDTHPDPPHNRRAALLSSAIDERGYCQYREEDIPNYWAYAREYVLCDNYFADILGPSIPNYFPLMGAEPPFLDNPRSRTKNQFRTPTIADQLSARGIGWRNYDDGIVMVSMFKGPFASGNIVAGDRFMGDARGGRLSAVSWLTPSIRDSEHPPHSVRRGEDWTVRRINAVMQGPQWARSAILIVYDEWGGFWDHVAPPAIEFEPAAQGAPAPIRYGYRVPCLVVSPYARRGAVSHTLYSHASVARTIGRIFDLPPLGRYDAAANDLLDCFDFAQKPRAPLILAPRDG